MSEMCLSGSVCSRSLSGSVCSGVLSEYVCNRCRVAVCVMDLLLNQNHVHIDRANNHNLN